MHGNKSNAEKALIKHGWKVIKGEVLCNHCATGEIRPVSRTYGSE